MESWLSYEIFAGVHDTEPASASVLSALTPEGRETLEQVERAIGRFYDAHRRRISGIYIFHYRDHADQYLGPAEEQTARLRAGQHVELIRLRFRVDAADRDWARAALRAEVLEASALRGRLAGWRLVDYSARADVGARFGDLDHGVDPTDEVVKILTGSTELRFLLLEHPGFTPNHDVIHLYFNALGLFYPQELAALEARAEKVRGFMKRKDYVTS